MHFVTIIVLHVSLVWHDVTCRGPHHPRGDSIAKQHTHYRPTKDMEQNIIQDSELVHDKEHLEEHLEDVIDKPDLDSFTDEELDFYYFQVHDVDRNNKLDGLEILQAIQHTHHEHHDADGVGAGDGAGGAENEVDNDEKGSDFAKALAEEVRTSLEYYTELIDTVFAEDDLDNDGYLSYPEYKAGRERDVKIPTARKPVQVQPPVSSINSNSVYPDHTHDLLSVQMS